MTEARQTFLVFACGSSWYGVPSEAASEVVTYPSLARVPGAAQHLLGVFAHRGEVIPVVDLASLTGTQAEKARRAVLLRLRRGPLALTANKVAGVVGAGGRLEPLGTSGVMVHLKGPMKAHGHDVAVIEPEGLFEYLAQQG